MEISTPWQLLRSLAPPSGDFRPNPPKLPRSPSRSGSSQEAGRKIVLLEGGEVFGEVCGEVFFWQSFRPCFAGTFRAKKTSAKTSAQYSHHSAQQNCREISGKNFMTRFCRGTLANLLGDSSGYTRLLGSAIVLGPNLGIPPTSYRSQKLSRLAKLKQSLGGVF